MVINLDQIAASSATELSNQISKLAAQGGNEADFRREVSNLLQKVGENAGLTIVQKDEYSIADGRADSVYNRLILEYKKPSWLRNSNSASSNIKVIEQMKTYILDLAKKDRRDSGRLAGVCLDGSYLIFVRRVADGWVIDDPAPVNPHSVERLLRLLFSLSTGAALIPENLISDFGPKTPRARNAVKALHSKLLDIKNPLTFKLFEQWRAFFCEATDYKEWAEKIEKKSEFRAFVEGMGISLQTAQASRIFFALHTYYALLIKLMASLIASRFSGGGLSLFQNLANKSGLNLHAAFKVLEDGGAFKDFGIRNFLEGDFFGWYLLVWDDEIEASVSDLAKCLSEYDPSTLELAPENARDLLKKLYHNLLPKEIRHDLGEYYTPDWLAERLIVQTVGSALGDPAFRILDPSCGSGTFLVLLIKHIRERAKKLKCDPTETLELILKNVVGIDLNPLAVIAARTNYLLALGDLIKARRRDIDIPIYQADAILTPSPGGDLFDGNIYKLQTAAGTFLIPKAFSIQNRMDGLTNLLSECIEGNFDEDAFFKRVSKEVDISADELRSAKTELIALFVHLQSLHQKGLDGVWPRIIKNAFAPLFIEPVDFIVGNPPWVNWESLPDEYRDLTTPLWKQYGLFVHGGMDTILGKGKKDISMLMTSICVDRYLKNGGKLGFVLSQSLFKTTGAGQGFRTFRLPDKITYGPLIVEDMVQLKPFEGAANRTVCAIFRKGNPVQYPVTYSLWKKSADGRKGAIGFDSPYDEVATNKIQSTNWVAEPINANDLTSAWMTGRPKALRVIKSVVGRSYYTARAGAFTGGANGIYWMQIIGQRTKGISVVRNLTEGIKKSTPEVEAAIENELLFPLLRGREVSAWHAEPSDCILMTQDPKTRMGVKPEIMMSLYPKAYLYLSKSEALLRSRAAFKRYFKNDDPFYSMFNVSKDTFSPWKVVWREQANSMTAAVIGSKDGKPIIPDHKLMLVASKSEEEAHFICGCLNSTPAKFVTSAYSVSIQMDTHILENILIPEFNPKNDIHKKLSELSRQAHMKPSQIMDLKDQIDLSAGILWGLSSDGIEEIKRAYTDY